MIIIKCAVSFFATGGLQLFSASTGDVAGGGLDQLWMFFYHEVNRDPTYFAKTAITYLAEGVDRSWDDHGLRWDGRST